MSCWPTPVQEKLLRACFLQGDAGEREFHAWRREADPGNLDESSWRLLPILALRWGAQPLDSEIAGLGSRVRLAVWKQNRQRFELASSLVETLAEAGVECVLLKGMALLLRYYADTGLRALGDIDVLVRRGNAARAVRALEHAGWIAEDGLTPEGVVSRMRVRHALQFSRRDQEDCDLHWHPVVRCYSPVVSERFWAGTEPATIGSCRVLIPGATEQLFHVCAHGLQWNWTPQIRWIPDALAILASSAAIDWDRLLETASAANMTVRTQAALHYLRTRMQAPVPESLEGQLPPRWERHEYGLLQKPCPLGPLDSARWHLAHFRRIRPFDREWSQRSGWIGFMEYLGVFLNIRNAGALAAALWGHFKTRMSACTVK